MAEAKAIGYLELNISGFNEAVETAKRVMVGLAATFAAYKFGDYFKSATAEAINFGNAMYQAGQKLGGYDPGKLLLVQKALERAGLSAGEAQGKINEFLNAGRSLEDIFHGVEGYGEALRQVGKDFGSQASILSRSAEAFSRVYDLLGSVGEKLKTFFLAGTEEFLGPLNAVLEALNQIDLAKMGKDFGDAMTRAVNILLGLVKDGDFLKALQIGVEIAFKEGVNYLVGGVKTATDVLAASISQIFSIKFASGIAQILFGVGTMFEASMLEAFQKPLKFFSDGMGYIIKTVTSSLAVGFAFAGKALVSVLKPTLEFYDKILGTHRAEALEKSVNSMGQEGLKGVNQTFSQYRDEKKDEKVFGINTKALSSLGGGMLASGVAKTASTGKDVASASIDAIKGFKAASFYNTEEQKKALEAIAKKAQSTGEAITGKAPDSKTKINQQALDPVQPYHVIADSLAKVGGGGNFVRVGQNLLEREAVKQTRTQEQMVKELQAISGNTKEGGGTLTLSRG